MKLGQIGMNQRMAKFMQGIENRPAESSPNIHKSASAMSMFSEKHKKKHDGQSIAVITQQAGAAKLKQRIGGNHVVIDNTLGEAEQVFQESEIA